MKFAYVDESGDQSQSDVFVMAGVVVDAYRLRKHTAIFDELISAFLKKHPSSPKELKTKAFINGGGGWSKIDAADRKDFLRNVCKLSAECGKVFGVGISFKKFAGAIDGEEFPFGGSYWLASALFVASLIQQKVQGEKRNKGLTVLICDDNKMEMEKLSDALYKPDGWFDPLYQKSRRRKGMVEWISMEAEGRFDHIVNTAFAIKSHHSSLIQAVDAVCYVYRRSLELQTGNEAWEGEAAYINSLAEIIEPARNRLGRRPEGACIDFYKAIAHDHWAL